MVAQCIFVQGVDELGRWQTPVFKSHLYTMARAA